MGTARVQSGRLLVFGNVRLNGFTKADLANMFVVRKVTDPANPYRTLVYMLPQDVIDNTIKAYSVSATGYTAGTPTGRYFSPANGPDCIESTPGFGDCGVRSVIVTGPKTVRFDMSLSKDILMTSRVGFRFDVQIFNVFNNVNFNPVGMPSSANAVALTSYEVTGASDSSRGGQLAFRITF
jgi:hypothetical protein